MFRHTLIIAVLIVAFLQLTTVARTNSRIAPVLESAHRTAAPTIKVYFVSGMFSSIQRQAVWEGMREWQSARKNQVRISFVDSGETGGLIDCEGCFTVVREDRYSKRSKRRSSFNALRHDDLGRLASAWIGLDQATESCPDLKELVRTALATGLGN